MTLPAPVRQIPIEVYSPGTEALRSNLYEVEVLDNLFYSGAYVFSSTQKAWQLFSSVEFTLLDDPLWEYEDYPIMNYVTFGTPEPTRVRIKKKSGTITSVDIGPYSKNKQYTIVNNVITIFDVRPYDKLWITINNDKKNPLFIFADPPQPTLQTLYSTYPASDGWFIYSFPQGITHLSSIAAAFPQIASPFTVTPTTGPSAGIPITHTHRIRAPGPKTVFHFPGGSYVIGNFDISGLNDIKFVGPGIVSLEYSNWWDVVSHLEPERLRQNFCPLFQGSGGPNAYLDYRFSGIELSGPSFIRLPFWFNGGGITTCNNVKVIAPWNYNSDGPKITNYQDRQKGAEMKNCFFFTGDDTIRAGGQDGNILVSSCYVASYGAFVFYNYFPAYRWSTAGQNYTASVVDMDVRSYRHYNDYCERRGNGAVFGIFSDTTVSSDDVLNYPFGLENMFYSGIRVENKPALPLFAIGNRRYPYTCNPAPSAGYDLGTMTNFIFKDITVSSNTKNATLSSLAFSSVIWGLDRHNRPTNFLFENIRINGQLVSDDNKYSYFNHTTPTGVYPSGWGWIPTTGVGSVSARDVVDPRYNPDSNINFSTKQSFAMSAFSSAGALDSAEIYPGPGPGTRSFRSNYDVRVFRDGYYMDTYVYSATRQAWAPLSGNYLFASGSYPPMSWVTIGCSSTIGLKIPNVTSVDIKPKNKNTNYLLSGNNLYLTANPNDHLWLTINNQVSSPLFIFADPRKPAIPSTGNLIYFGQGVSSIGNYQVTSNNTTVYFDGGSVVKGSFDIRGRSNVKFVGPGVLMPMDTSTAESFRSSYQNSTFINKLNSGYVMIRGSCDDVFLLEGAASGNSISGLTIVNSPWHSVFGGINNISNFKLISPWYHSTYGPSLVADSVTRKSSFINSFIFNADNCLVDFSRNSGFNPRKSEGNFVASSLFLNTVNNAPIGVYTVNYHPSSVTPYQMSATNLDIGVYQNPIKNTSNPSSVLAAIHIFNSSPVDFNSTYKDLLSHQNYTFTNVRIDNYIDCPIFRIVNASSPFGYPSADQVSGIYGSTKNLVFKNVTASGAASSVSGNSISGLDSDYNNRPSNITFINLTINNTLVDPSNYQNYFKFSNTTDPGGIYFPDIEPNIYFKSKLDYPWQ
jgi:hypothetical protein